MESTTIPPVRRIRRGAEQWRKLLDRFEQSGQTQEQFCTRHDLGLSTFRRWRKRLCQQSPMSSSDALFVELSQDVRTTQPWDVELELGGGVCLRLRRAGC